MRYIKQTFALIAISSLAFLMGFEVRSLSKAPGSSIQDQTVVSPATATPAPTPCSQQDEFSHLINDKHITKFNGTRLELAYDYGPTPDDIPFHVDDAKIVGLDDGGLLVSYADTLYRLDAQQRAIWTYSTAQVIFDYVYVESTGLIYGTAGDNVMFVLDATTGEFKTGESRNGSAQFGGTANYGRDLCLVTDNFGIYRERAHRAGIERMNDGIALWQGTTKLWSIDFPPDAELVVAGKRILAVTKSKTAIYVNEIKPPPAQND